MFYSNCYLIKTYSSAGKKKNLSSFFIFKDNET